MRRNGGLLNLNLNTMAKVTLTKFGASVFNAHWKNSGVPQKYRPGIATSGTVLDGLTFGEIMRIFSHTVYIHAGGVPFADNVIELPDETKNEK